MAREKQDGNTKAKSAHTKGAGRFCAFRGTIRHKPCTLKQSPARGVLLHGYPTMRRGWLGMLQHNAQPHSKGKATHREGCFPSSKAFISTL